jgi:hypothetical protein
MLLLPLLLLPSVILASQPVPLYKDLPTLRTQDELEQRWVQKRYDLIPSVLEKQYVLHFLYDAGL